MKRAAAAVVLFLAAALPIAAEETTRPETWAQPVAGYESLPNLHRVDEGLYRGAQPEEDGFAALKELGVKTVVCLRSDEDQQEEAREAGLDYVRVPMRAWNVKDEKVVEFLRIATDPERRPVFVHCYHGADRTGMMVAMYRVVEQGWSPDEAVAEMEDGGFGFHDWWQNLLAFVRKADAEFFREAVRGAGPAE